MLISLEPNLGVLIAVALPHTWCECAYVLLTIPDALLVTTDMPSSGYNLFNEAYIMTAIDLNFHNQLLLDWINPAYMKMSEWTLAILWKTPTL